MVGGVADVAIVSPGTSTSTAAVQRASVLPAAQLLPAAVDTTGVGQPLVARVGVLTVTV